MGETMPAQINCIGQMKTPSCPSWGVNPHSLPHSEIHCRHKVMRWFLWMKYPSVTSGHQQIGDPATSWTETSILLLCHGCTPGEFWVPVLEGMWWVFINAWGTVTLLWFLDINVRLVLLYSSIRWVWLWMDSLSSSVMRLHVTFHGTWIYVYMDHGWFQDIR